MEVEKLILWTKGESEGREFERAKIAYYDNERWPYLEVTLTDDMLGVKTLIVSLSEVEEMSYYRV